MLGISKRK